MARKQMKSGTTSDGVGAVSPVLIEDIRQIIGEARRSVATTVNAGLTLLYWRIGNWIVNEVLGNSGTENWVKRYLRNLVVTPQIRRYAVGFGLAVGMGGKS